MHEYCRHPCGPAGLQSVLQLGEGEAGALGLSVVGGGSILTARGDTMGVGAGAATRAAAAAVSPRGAWAGFSAPLPAQAAVNRARAPGPAGQG